MRTTTLRTTVAATGLLAALAVAGCGATTTGTAQGAAAPSQDRTFSQVTAPDAESTTVAPPPTQTAPAAPTDTAPAAAPPAKPARTDAATKAAVTPECKSAGLRVSIGQSDSAMSHTGRNLRFTNVGTKPCVLVGFPGVSYVAGDKGVQVGAAAVRQGRIGAQLTVAPGHSVYSFVIGVSAAAYDPGVCRPTPVRGFRVYPPDETAAVFVPLPAGTQGCAGTLPNPQLDVQTMQSGQE